MKSKEALKLFVLLVGLVSVTVGATKASFADSVKSKDNTFTAGTWELPKAATPTFTPPEGKYTSAQSVEINTATIGAAIYYTTDGTAPTAASTLYTGTINVDDSVTLKAVAIKAVMRTSDIATADYIIDKSSPPPVARVLINEVYYDVAPPKGTENLNEWIELFNAGDLAANLKNWTLTDNSGTAKTLSSQDAILNPQQFAVIVKNIVSYLSYWPDTPASTLLIEVPNNNALSNDGDRLVLKDDSGEVIDQMSYGTDATVLNPSVPDVPEGQSIERSPDGADTDSAADFTTNTTPTPGE